MEKQISDLTLERVQLIVNQVKTALAPLSELAQLTDEVKSEVQRQLADYALSLRTTKLKPEELEAFFKKPYVLEPVPGRQDNWHLIIPRFVDVQFGWLEKQTESFNIFLVNRYVDWLGELPDTIKQQLGFKPGLKLELQGDTLLGPREDMEKAWQQYRPYLKDRDEKHILINTRRAFELIASMIRDGILPFTPKPVPQSDLIDRPVNFELRDYQKDAYAKFLQYSNIGVFYPASVGKTFLALYAMSKLKGPHLVVVPSLMLQEQWLERIVAHTELKPEDYVVCTYYTAIKKHASREWGLLTIDETHHLPSNQFSKLSLIKRKYTMGLTASPQREDGRESFIFALTGFPVGLGWSHFKELGIIKSPTCHVWLVKNFEAKLTRLKALLAEEKKTLIFSDSIEIGKTIASRFNVPHVYGETKEGRLSTIETSPAVVVSRVADEGISLPAIERIIEISWLYGSRRQELQRFTRLLHGRDAKIEGEHHILMTLDEYLHDRKRLFSVMDKGFKLEIHREGVSEQSISRRLEEPYRRLPRIPSPPVEKPALPMASTTTDVPGDVKGLFELPGVKKIMQSLTGSQERFYSLLLQNDGQWFRRSQLPLVLGYTNDHSMGVVMKFQELIGKHLIEAKREGKEWHYRTNIRGRL